VEHRKLCIEVTSMPTLFSSLSFYFQSNRKTWELELDISAPQIIFVEHFCDKNAVIAVVDFGRLYLSTCPKELMLTLNKDVTSNADITDRDSGDDGKYLCNSNAESDKA